MPLWSEADFRRSVSAPKAVAGTCSGESNPFFASVSCREAAHQAFFGSHRHESTFGWCYKVLFNLASNMAAKSGQCDRPIADF